MITQVQLPTIEALQPLIDEALLGGELSEDDFVEQHCAGIIKILAENPLRYRDYGAYWWPVKDILNKQGYGDFVGAEQEEVTASHWRIENDVATLCAAWFYQNAMVEGGKSMNSIHTYTIDVDGDFEEFEYSIEDPNMEMHMVQ